MDIFIKDVTVINRVNIGSDHRLLRAKVHLNTRLKRIKLIKSNQSKSPLAFEKLHENKDYFNLEIYNKFQILDIEGCNDVDEINQQTTRILLDASNKIAKRQGSSLKAGKLTIKTLNLIKQRNDLAKNSNPGQAETKSDLQN